jgi:nicotinate-nucleotide adenylyltransferase
MPIAMRSSRRSASKPTRPFLTSGMTVGLFGGSFDPPHAGHKLVSDRLATALGLDLVWWLVSPQNPLKQTRPGKMEERLQACRALVKSARVHVSDEETRLGTANTIDTVRKLKAQYPGVSFIWLMGADNLAGLHRWKNWAGLMAQIPVAIYPRPGYQIRAGLSPAANRFAGQRLAAADARLLKTAQPPVWVMLEGRMDTNSSTKLRHKKTL